MKAERALLDYLGIAASTVCGVHCLLSPLVAMVLPVASAAVAVAPHGHDHGHWHAWVLVGSLLVALLSLLPGWWRHRRAAPLGWALPGAVALLLVVAEGLPHGGLLEALVAASGAAFLVVAHVVNLRLGAACCAAPPALAG
jgi:hypothetical protein